MGDPSSAWKEGNWEYMDVDALITFLNSQLEPSLSDGIPDVHTTETVGDIGPFNSVGAGELLAEDLGALDMGASRPPERPQHMWFNPQDPSQQYNNDNFQEENINFGSMGSHLPDDWTMTYDVPPDVPSCPFYGFDLQSIPASLPDSFTQGSLPFRQSFMEKNQGVDFTAIGFNGLDHEGFGTTSSLAVEASTSSDSSGSRSSPRHGQPMSTSSGSSGEDTHGHENIQIAPKRARMPKPKQIFPCSFSPCFRTFTKKFELRKHEKIHTLPYKCPVCSEGKATKKSIHRHLWTAHEDYALREKIPSENRTCHFEGCGKVCRGDNLKRHIRLKHR